MIGILQVKNDIGRCRPLYDAAQNMIDAGCVMGLDSLVSCTLRCIIALPCFSCIFSKGDNFYYSLFAYPCDKYFLEEQVLFI